jgi:hypothetical protein
MKSGIPIVFALFLSATLLAEHGGSGEPQPPRNGLEDSVQGVFVTPIEGVPFSATVEIRDKILKTDGTIATWESINEIARDDTGRIHNEIRQAMPEGFTGIPEILEVHIFDPQSRLNTYYDTRTRVASQRVLYRPPTDLNAQLLASRKPQFKDLGTTALNGIECRGTQETYTIPAFGNAADEPVTFTYEFWYSKDLQINILMHQTDSHGGEKTVSVLQIKREPPDSALFEVPDGYRIVDVTVPPSTLVRHRLAR